MLYYFGDAFVCMLLSLDLETLYNKPTLVVGFCHEMLSMHKGFPALRLFLQHRFEIADRHFCLYPFPCCTRWLQLYLLGACALLYPPKLTGGRTWYSIPGLKGRLLGTSKSLKRWNSRSVQN